MADDCTLQQKIHELEVEVSILRTKLESSETTRSLQAVEYERRLQELNHNLRDQHERNALFVSRESWDIHNSKMDDWRRSIDQWRWISVGMGAASGGAMALLARLFQ